MTQAKLYQYNACPFCWKVKTLLAYKKVPHEVIEVHPLNKKEISFSKDYRKVPIWIEKNGEQVNDSTVIMRHVDALYDDKPVFEIEATAQEEENKWLLWADEKLVRALPPLIYQTIGEALEAFDYISKIEKFGWLQKNLIKYSGALVMNQVAKKSAKSQGIKNPTDHFKNILKLWASNLEKKDFMGGKKPNGADLAAFGILRSIEDLPAFKILKENERVLKWYQAVGKLL